jgi:hypothetical protein
VGRRLAAAVPGPPPLPPEGWPVVEVRPDPNAVEVPEPAPAPPPRPKVIL